MKIPAHDTGSDDATNALEGVGKAERDTRAHDTPAAAQSQRLQVPQEVAAVEKFLWIFLR